MLAFCSSFTVDHSLFVATSLYNNQQIIDYCRVNESEFFHSYLIAYRYHLTDVIPYHMIEFPFYTWITILMTFSWNFIDLFIILISVGLATRFNQINERLLSAAAKSESDDKFWTEIRINYYAMIDLVDVIDQEISILVLLSTGHNLFSMCVNIFECLTK
jgi:gustatory receptor